MSVKQRMVIICLNVFSFKRSKKLCVMKTITGYRLDSDMQESLDMMVHKISRILYGDPYHTDNWLDIAGYIMLVANRLQLEEEFNERTK
jgi:hypothetical protein